MSVSYPREIANAIGDDRWCGGAIWRLPNLLEVQLVYLDGDRFVLHNAGCAVTDQDGQIFYAKEELQARFAGATYLGQDSGRWMWDVYVENVQKDTAERSERSSGTS